MLMFYYLTPPVETSIIKKDMAGLEELLTIDEVSAYLKIKPRQVYRYMGRETNPLPAIEMSTKAKRVSKQALIDWMARNTLGLQKKTQTHESSEKGGQTIC